MSTKYEKLAEAAAVAKDHIDYGAGVITIAPEGINAVAQHLGADLDAIKKAQTDSTEIGAALMMVSGQRAMEEMTNDQNITAITSEYNVGNETYSHTHLASDEVLVKSGSDETRTVYFNTKSTVTNSSGEDYLKHVRNKLRQLKRDGLGDEE